MAHIKKSTGKSLQQWGDQYGITRERVRQLYNRWGTITDELMMNRDRDFGGWKYTVSKFQKWQGLTLAQMAEKYNTTYGRIRHWYRDYPTLTWAQFKQAVPSNQSAGRTKILVNGLTLQQWADRWNISYMHICGLYRKWGGTVSDELLSKRPRSEPHNPWYKNPKDDPK